MSSFLKNCFAVLSLSTLVGCTASIDDKTSSFQLPEELKDYKILKLRSTSGNDLYIVIKKNPDQSTTVAGTHLPGKVPVNCVIIDGKTFSLNPVEKSGE